MSEWTEWQPIATAPEDRPVLVVGTLNNMLEPFPEMFVAEYSRGWWAASHVLSHVTHWRELPGFPSDAAAVGASEGVGYADYHWHWAAIINELIAHRKSGPQRGLA